MLEELKITFEGVEKAGKLSNLIFHVQNQHGKNDVKIPVSNNIADMIMLRLHRFAPPPPKPVERGNDEEAL